MESTARWRAALIRVPVMDNASSTLMHNGNAVAPTVGTEKTAVCFWNKTATTGLTMTKVETTKTIK